MKTIKDILFLVGTIIGIIFVGGLLLFAVGTIGDIVFKLTAVIQNNIGKLLLALAALSVVVWIIKNKGED